MSHFNGQASSPDFEPPFTDPLIDEVYFQFNVSASLFSERLSAMQQQLTSTGVFGRIVVTLRVKVHCAEGWNGTNCETFCDFSSGNATCSQGTR